MSAPGSLLQAMAVAVVDDHELVRRALCQLVRARGAVRVEDFATAAAFEARLAEGYAPDFCLVDLELRGEHGFGLVGRLAARGWAPRLAVCTVHDEIWTLRRLEALGVGAIVYKSAAADEVGAALEALAAGGRYRCAEAREALGRAADDSLHPSPREMDVLRLVARGRTTKEIAAALFVSENTVEAHRKSLFRRLGVNNVAGLLAEAEARGYLIGQSC